MFCDTGTATSCHGSRQFAQLSQHVYGDGIPGKDYMGVGANFLHTSLEMIGMASAADGMRQHFISQFTAAVVESDDSNDEQRISYAV